MNSEAWPKESAPLGGGEQEEFAFARDYRHETLERIAADTLASVLHPDRNEDAYFAEKRAFGVFDGMGGVKGGEYASRLAKEVVAERLAAIPAGASIEEVKDFVRDALLGASEAVMDEAGRSALEGMGTTATVAVLAESAGGEPVLIFGHVGDTRAYLLRNNVLEKLTIDDNKFAQDPEIDKALDTVRTEEELSGSSWLEAAFLSRNRIMQVLGRGGAEPHITAIELDPKDRIFLTSDGVHDNLTRDEMQEIARAAGSSEELVRSLLDAALERSKDDKNMRHKADDMTVVAVEL